MNSDVKPPNKRPLKRKSSARVSLTKLQQESAAGVELISICRQVTEDGRLSEREVADLSDWIEKYQHTSLAGHTYLKQVYQHTIADGVITADELRELYAAIEKVLPPNIRAEVVGRRRASDELERELNSPIDGWDFMVAGCRYEGRPKVITRYCRPGDDVFLVRDPDNKYSRFAVEVRVESGHQIGFVPETDVRELAPLLDADHPYRASVKKILRGGRGPIPIVVADVYGFDATMAGLRRSADAPPKTPGDSGPGCLPVVAVAALSGIAMIAAFR